MLNVKDVLSLEFYKKSPFHGSLDGIRYRIEKDDDGLKCTMWPEPYSYDSTDKSLMEEYIASFDEEGLSDIVRHINDKVKAVD